MGQGRDWVGAFFDVIKRHGDDARFFLKVSNVPRPIEFDHAKFDGSSALVHYVRTTAGLSLVKAPGVPPREKPGFWKRLGLYLEWTRKLPLDPRWWRASRAPASEAPVDFEKTWATRVLTKEQTDQARLLARKHDVSLNSLLLHRLDRAIGPLLEPSSKATLWMMPVSFLGKVTVDLEPRNRASFVDISMGEATSAKELHEMVAAEIERGTYWGLDLSYPLLMWPGAWFLSMIYPAVKKQIRRTGVFTNAGSWTIGGTDVPEELSAIPPVISCLPFGASALEVNGRLALTVRADRVIDLSHDDLQGIVARWVASLTDATDAGPARAELPAG